MLIYLMEMTYYDATSLVPVTLYYSSGQQGYTTLPTDAPANQFYEPRLKVPLNYQCSTFKDGLKGGSADGGYGVAELLNLDGFFDQFLTQNWDGHPVRLLYGDDAGPYANFNVLLTGVMCQPEFTWRMMNLKVRDYTEFFDKPISQFNYLGNNVAGVGIEGTPTDLMGKSKPMAFGACPNVTPSWVSQSGLIYQVHNGPIKAVDAVYSNGISLPLDTSIGTGGDCANLAALQAATPGAGKYITCLAIGCFATSGGAASTAITADIRGDNTGGVYVSTVADICQRIVTTYTQRPRKNYLPWSEAFGSGAWTSSGFSVVLNPAVTPPIAGMGLAQLTGAANSSFSYTLALGTGMFCFSPHLQGAGSVRLMISDPANEANNVSADFNLATGIWSNVLANGLAVGPQYTATGFITAAGVIQTPNGFWRCWVAGQPNSSFTNLKVKVITLDGSPIVIGGSQVEAYSSPALYTGPTTGTAAGSDSTGSYYAIGYDPIQGPGINAASFAAFKTVAPYEVNFYVAAGDTTTSGDVMNALCQSVGGWWGFDRSGNMVVGQFNKPLGTATPVQTFTPWYILQDTFDRSAPFDSKDGAPAFRVVLQCVCNWTPQAQSTLASSLWLGNPTRVAWLAQQWRQARYEDITILYQHPLACELDFTTYLTQQADATAECQRLLAMYSGHMDKFTFTTKMDYAIGVTVGSIVNIMIPRFGLTNGKNFQVISMTEAHETGHVTIGVLG